MEELNKYTTMIALNKGVKKEELQELKKQIDKMILNITDFAICETSLSYNWLGLKENVIELQKHLQASKLVFGFMTIKGTL